MFNPVEFPNLQKLGFTPRSPKTQKYNCLAWAAGDTKKWWSPLIPYYWPKGANRALTMEAFIAAYKTVGFIECPDAECSQPPFEKGVERIAIYALAGQPKHAARQINENVWTSKMGGNIDMEHPLKAVEGPTYGTVSKIMKRS